MPDQGQLSSKVRAYMEALSPNARSMLARAMQNGQQRGEGSAPHEAILKAVAELEPGLFPARPPVAPVAAAAPGERAVEPDAPAEPWEDQLRQAIFLPVNAFTCDAALPMKQPGRIYRESLAAIWIWLKRDLAPALVGAALEAGGRGNLMDAATVARRLRRDLTPLIIEALRQADADSKMWRRLAGLLGGDMILSDLGDVAYVFQREAALANFVGQLPRVVSCPDPGDPSPILDLVRRCLEETQVDPSYLAVLMIPRAGSAAVVGALAMRLAGTNDPRLVQTSPYARIIDTVISEVELWVSRVDAHLANRLQRPQVIDDLRNYHDLVRQLDLAISPNEVPVWFRRLGAARKRMSDVLTRELEPLPGVIRRATRVESLGGQFGGRFDQDACEDAEFGVRLLAEARLALDSLALNELVPKTRKQVEQTLEVITNKLMSDYKSGAAFDRDSLLKAIDGAIRMCAVAFGEDYAGLLRKSRDLAVNKSRTAT